MAYKQGYRDYRGTLKLFIAHNRADKQIILFGKLGTRFRLGRHVFLKVSSKSFLAAITSAFY